MAYDEATVERIRDSVDAETIASDGALSEWVRRGVAFARSLPPK